jgi:phosphoglycolate phosphatase
MLLNAMAEAGAVSNNTVMIGDTTFDIEMAVNARVRAIGVSWGYHEPDALIRAGAEKVVSTMNELLETLFESVE